MSKELKKIIISSVLLIIGLVVEIFIQTPTIFGIDLIPLAIFLIAYLVVGFEIILEVLEEIKELDVFDEDFLMCIASIGAFIIGEWAEGAAIMLLFCVGEYFEDLSKDKTRKAVQSLMDIRPLKANVIKDGKIIEVEPKDVKVGDLVLLKNGEKLAVDGVVVEGDGMLDTAALTGENVPRHVMVGSEVLSGSINVYTALTVRCVKEYQDSVVAKILELVESQTGRKAKTENFIRKFARIYTPAVCILALLIAIVPSIITKDLSTWVYRAISFLVVSCPCALVISVPLSYFLGIGGASKYGILIKGANYLELVNQIDYVVFDKTGTLTDGTFKVVDVFPSQSKEEILRLASICELKSNHPIAKSVLQANTSIIDRNFTVSEEAGMGVVARKDEQVLACGNNKLMAKLGVEVPFDKDVLGTVCHLAKNGEYVGTVVIADTIKPEAKKT
ncbi:MAG: heavy metal translocating P-type ATPase, partial [Clostridia bacterium]|nr:heavy metal translocating P-type ATPase [Clostridia bacterium]